jgi:hypothetical protein
VGGMPLVPHEARYNTTPPTFADGASAELQVDEHGVLKTSSTVGNLPSTLGAKTAAASLPVTLATDDVLVAPLQAVRDRLPDALGSQTLANSLSVGLANDSKLLLANTPVASIAPAARVAGNGAAQQLGTNTCSTGVWVQVVGETTAGAVLSTTGANVGNSDVSATRGIYVPVNGVVFLRVTNTNAVWFFAASTCTISYWWA